MFPALRLNNIPRIYHCEPGWNWAPTPLPDYDLWCVLGGRGAMILGETSFVLQAGSCFLIKPGDAPRATQEPQQRLTVFAVHFDFLDEAGQITAAQAEPIPQSCRVRDLAFLSLLAHRCAECFAQGLCGRRQSELCIRQIQLLMQAEAETPGQARRDEAIYQLSAALQKEPGQRWTVESMARSVHLSRSQFARRFQAALGESPNRFLVRVRVERARQLLLETDMTLSQIASALGYPDAAFFSRQFKQFYGMAPGALRRSS